MRRGRIFIYLALIIILGLVAVYVLYQRGSQQPAAELGDVVVVATPVVEDIDVVVVTQNTPQGTVLDETLLTTIKFRKTMRLVGCSSRIWPQRLADGRNSTWIRASD